MGPIFVIIAWIVIVFLSFIALLFCIAIMHNLLKGIMIAQMRQRYLLQIIGIVLFVVLALIPLYLSFADNILWDLFLLPEIYTLVILRLWWVKRAEPWKKRYLKKSLRCEPNMLD